MERSASLVSASTVRLAEAEASWEKRCKRERASLSLRFNHGKFCDGLYVHRKRSEGVVFSGSGRSF